MDLPTINLKHFNYLTDDFGIWQHTRGDQIDKKMGYALDDSARALLVASARNLTKEGKVFINFIEQSIEKNANFFDNERHPMDFPVSDDAVGEACWALGFCVNRRFLAEEADKVLKKIFPRLETIENLRGVAYSVIGLSFLDKNETKKLANRMRQLCIIKDSRNWRWPEVSLNYGNAIIPLAFLSAFEKLGDLSLLDTGMKYLDFLNEKTKYYGKPIAIGNKGWYKKGQSRSLFDQQPIDPAYQILANSAAYRVTKDKKYQKEAIKYYLWFWGKNLKKLPMVDAAEESVRDGLQEKGVSSNRGAEGIICYLMAQDQLNIEL